MSENRFRIVFDGALLPGVDVTTAKLNLAHLFKTDVQAIEWLFTGQPTALKRDLSQADAQTCLHALKKTGIDARIESEPAIGLNLQEDRNQFADAAHWPAEPQSPYAPPRSAVGETRSAYAPLKAFSFEGRIGRLRFLAWTMVLTLATLVVGTLLTIFGFAVLTSDSSAGLILAGLIAAILATALAIVSIQFSVQRLHDLGWSGWLWLLTLVPFVGSFFPLVMMVAPGNSTTNRYGPPPPANSATVKVLASLWLVFLVVLFVGGMTGGLTALQAEYDSATDLSYDSDVVSPEEIHGQAPHDAQPATDSADEAAE